MKTRVYAKSSGHKNAAILIPADTPCPPGHTLKKPPEPEAGHTVVWQDDDWVQVPIPEQEAL